jgi:hypothetical protein
LIDFNPRYYHYLAFDIARGMPLPLMVHAAATGDRAELARLVTRAERDRGPRAFSYRLQLEELLIAQRISAALRRGPVARVVSRPRGRHRRRRVVEERSRPLPRRS